VTTPEETLGSGNYLDASMEMDDNSGQIIQAVCDAGRIAPGRQPVSNCSMSPSGTNLPFNAEAPSRLQAHFSWPLRDPNRLFQELARLTQRDLPHPAGPACSEHEDIGGPLDVLGNIVWFVLAGWWLALGHLVTAVVLAFRLLGRILSLLALRSGRLAR
jgi:hypothetical protein